MCGDECCPDETQLCVDAQFFVPECDIDDCYGTYLDFAGIYGLYLNTAGIYVDTTVNNNNNVTFDLYVNNLTAPTTKIGSVKLNYTITTNSTDPNKVDLTWNRNNIGTITGINIVPGTNDSWVHISDSTTCKANMVNFANLLTMSIGTMTFSGITGVTSATIKNILEIKYAGQAVYQVSLADSAGLSSNASTALFSTFLQQTTSTNFANQVYPADYTTPQRLSQALVETSPKNPTPKDGCQAANIAEADLILQMRANKNVLQQDENNNGNAFKDGKYDLCISYKPCENNKWENRHIMRIEKSGNIITQTWGTETNKSGNVVVSSNDTALLSDENDKQFIKITTCGNVQDVFNNINDFTLHIENVMQAFSLFSKSGLIQPLSSVTGPKPYESNEVVLSNDKFIRAKLANCKLYLSLKYVCLVTINPTTSQNPVNICPGTLSPFTNTGVSGTTYTSVKGFITEELTHMEDHPLHGSKLSRERTLCLKNTDVAPFACP